VVVDEEELSGDSLERLVDCAIFNPRGFCFFFGGRGRRERKNHLPLIYPIFFFNIRSII